MINNIKPQNMGFKGIFTNLRTKKSVKLEGDDELSTLNDIYYIVSNAPEEKKVYNIANIHLGIISLDGNKKQKSFVEVEGSYGFDVKYEVASKKLTYTDYSTARFEVDESSLDPKNKDIFEKIIDAFFENKQKQKFKRKNV